MVCHVLDRLRLRMVRMLMVRLEEGKGRGSEILLMPPILFLGIVPLTLPFPSSSLERAVLKHSSLSAPFWLLTLTGRPLRTGHLVAPLEAGEIWSLREGLRGRL